MPFSCFPDSPLAEMHMESITTSREQTAKGTQKPDQRHSAPLFSLERLRQAIDYTSTYFLNTQSDEGYWVFDLEADTTISAEYIMLQRFLGRPIDARLLEKICTYLRSRQLPDGGWPLFAEDGDADISASVKAYFALKLAGDSRYAPHMKKARSRIVQMGGAAQVNVFTRITLALFGQIPWHTTPAMPVEIMMLPRCFFFHLYKISYWSRTVLVPLLILYAKRPVCRLNPEESIRELFVVPPEKHKHLDSFISGEWQKNAFILLDRLLKFSDRLMPRSLRNRAVEQARQWTVKRMQGEGGIGAIFPAMANAVMALQVLGYDQQDPDFARGLKAIDDLLVDRTNEAMCQPCLSPIWDTCITLTALLEAGLTQNHPAGKKSCKWLLDQQVRVKSDWAWNTPDLEPGGWAFQFENELYPDVDDTPMVLMSLFRAGVLEDSEKSDEIQRAVKWMVGMQSSDGGWGAFDIDNNFLYLNQIPFADHGALLDPSTSDVTARCIEVLAMLGYDRTCAPVARGLDFLRREQEPFGGWYGRWGVNYIYGTWSVLSAFRQVGEDLSQPHIRKAVAWLKACQNDDGGWGESCYTYNDPSLAGQGESTASQTAWALLGLMAAGETNSIEVQNGIHYLLSTQSADGTWHEKHYTGTGFPRVFYLQYHGYSKFFPLWALSVYHRHRAEGQTLQDELREKYRREPLRWLSV